MKTDAAFDKYGKVDQADVIDCPACEARGNRGQPISPAVGYCRRCRLSIQDARDWPALRLARGGM